MPAAHTSLIAREGWPLVGLAAGAAMVVSHFAGWWWGLPLWILVLLLLYLFRDPRREIPPMPLAVVAPADGEVIAVDSIRDPFLDRDAVCIAIAMALGGAFSTRAPIEARIQELPRRATEGKDQPHGIWLQTDEGDDLIMVMHRSRVGAAPRCYVQFGDRVGQGQRCGYAYFGAEVDVYVPANSRVKVKPGDRVRAGADVIALLTHK